MVSRFRMVWPGVALGALMLLTSGCNDTLRQFITPVPSSPPDPRPAGHAVILNTNPLPGNGSTMHINVSGDTIAGIVPVGVDPLFLAKAGARIFVLNNDKTVTSYFGLTPLAGLPNTITLPGTVTGPVAGGTSNSGNFFIANSGSNDVSVIAASVTASVASLPAGTTPVSVAGNANQGKIYVVNQGSDNVSVYSTIDNTLQNTIAVGSQPVWAVMSSDGLDVFVVNQGSNDVWVIDTSIDVVIAKIAVGVSPNFAFYEPNLKRLYVSNTGSNTVSIIKANGLNLGVNPQILPTKLADVPVSGAPVSVTALQDGTKAYAALGGCPAGTNHLNLLTNLASCNGNQVSVIDGTALRESKVLTVGAGAVSIDASNDSTRVYVVGAHDTTTVSPDPTITPAPAPRPPISTPSVSIIRTNSDTVVATLKSPTQVSGCVPTIDKTYNLTVPLPCPGQVPFMVRSFP